MDFGGNRLLVCEKPKYELLFAMRADEGWTILKATLPAFKRVNIFTFKKKYLVEVQLKDDGILYFTAEFLEFKMELRDVFRFSLHTVDYDVPQGAKGTVILIPLST